MDVLTDLVVVHARVEMNSMSMMVLSEQNECIGWALDLSLASGSIWARWGGRNGGTRGNRGDGTTWVASMLLDVVVPNSNITL